MRRLVIVSMLLVIAGQAAAQEEPQARAGRPHFGAPVLKFTGLRGQGAALFGGRGGVNVSPSLTLGAGLYGTLTEVNAREGAVPGAPGPLDLKVESFGLEVEYALRPSAPTHLTFGAFAGGAAAHYYKDKTNDQHGETDFMLQLEPSVGVEQRVTKWSHLNLALSYRLVRGVEQPGLETADVRGFAVAVALKLGRF